MVLSCSSYIMIDKNTSYSICASDLGKAAADACIMHIVHVCHIFLAKRSDFFSLEMTPMCLNHVLRNSAMR